MLHFQSQLFSDINPCILHYCLVTLKEKCSVVSFIKQDISLVLLVRPLLVFFLQQLTRHGLMCPNHGCRMKDKMMSYQDVFHSLSFTCKIFRNAFKLKSRECNMNCHERLEEHELYSLERKEPYMVIYAWKQI